MNTKTKKPNRVPGNIAPETAQKALALLNAAGTVEDVAKAIEGGVEQGMVAGIARKILDRRTRLSGFKELKQVVNVLSAEITDFTRVMDALATAKGADTAYVIEDW